MSTRFSSQCPKEALSGSLVLIGHQHRVSALGCQGPVPWVPPSLCCILGTSLSAVSSSLLFLLGFVRFAFQRSIWVLYFAFLDILSGSLSKKYLDFY